MSRSTFSILIIAVFLPSLLIRLHPTTSESFQYDAVVSQKAAREGVSANAWDTSGTYELRRFHPPLLAYIILLNNTIFGDSPFGARIFSIVFGSLACLAVAFAIAIHAPPGPMRIPAAIFGGWLLTLLPVHLYVSRTSNWDAVYGFFATSSLVCMASYAVEGSKGRLYAAATFATLAFLTCELGLVLLPVVGFLVLYDTKRMEKSQVAGRWALVSLFVIILITGLWPSGILKLDLLRSLLYRWRDSALEIRNLPWHAFYTTLFHEAPAFTLFIAFGIIAILVFPLPRAVRAASFLSRLPVVSLPFWIYVTTTFALSLKQRLVYVHHIVDMFPPLVIAVCLGLAGRASVFGPAGRRWAIAVSAAAVALSGLAALNPDPTVVGPQEHPGFLGVSDVLRDYPGARVYCYDRTVLGFYLPDASIEGGKTRFWTPDDVEQAKHGHYDFVVFDRAKLNEAYPTAEHLVAALTPTYRLMSVIQHRRTGEPVAWILSQSNALE